MDLPVNYNLITPYERRLVREAYIRQQGGRCSYCGNALNSDPIERVQSAKIDKRLFPKTMFKFPIHLHHNHNTGMTIGAVHARCNAYLWQFEGE